MNGPRRLRDDPSFFAETGVDLSAETEALAHHDLPRLKRRVMGAVARGQAPCLSPTRGGPGLGHWLVVVAVGGAIAGALAGAPEADPTTPAETAETQLAPTSSPVREAPIADVDSRDLSERPVLSPTVATDSPLEPLWVEVARTAPAVAATSPARPLTRERPRARRTRARPAREASPRRETTLTTPVQVTFPAPAATDPARDLQRLAQEPPSVALRSATFDKDLLEALAESLRRKTFK